jgi:hypothetical protein
MAYVLTLSVYSSNKKLKWSKTCVMNWKECERKRSWPKFKTFAGISLEGLKKSHLRPITISDLQFWAQDIPKKKKGTLNNTKNTTLT